MALNRLALKMKEAGIYVNQVSRAAHAVRLERNLRAARDSFVAAAGSTGAGIEDLSAGGEAEPGVDGDAAKSTSSNINSAKQLKRLYFGQFKVKPTRFSEKTGAPSLDENALKDILVSPTASQQAKETTHALLAYRESHKLKSTYVDRLDPSHPESYLFGGRDTMHPDWNVLQAKTGRWSCSRPNLQNIHKGEPGRPGMRDMFWVRDPDNWLVEADYKQLEIRIIAALSGCQLMIDAFNRGEDIYRVMAASLFNKPTKEITDHERKLTKIFILASNYGGGVKVIHEQMVVAFPQITKKACAELQKRHFQMHPEIPTFQKSQFRFARENNYVFCPISGRELQFYLDRIKPTEAANFPVQGTAGDIINPASIRADAAVDWKHDVLIMQVHDALYIETPNPDRGARILRDCMSGIVKLNGHEIKFDVDVKVGKSWGDMHEYSFPK
jgi:DNA polymerase-1